jgi:phosphatidate cytidylyltransferase
MVKKRIFFGALMIALFTGIVIFDGWLDGSLTRTTTDNRRVQGTIFCILIILLLVAADLEFAKLASGRKLKVFVPVSIVAIILVASGRYWAQFMDSRQSDYLLILFSFALLTIMLFQYLSFGISSFFANCGVNSLAFLYFGALGYFCVAVRVEFGLWPLLMYIFVVKCTDIGAYTAGKLFGKHKFSPNISPGKTWEGMAGGIIFAILVALGFAAVFGIMTLPMAIVFGICFAFIGQLGDLAESLLKRDAQQKDSANIVPSFGGIMDIIDSPLVGAPFAYLFFMWSS